MITSAGVRSTDIVSLNPHNTIVSIMALSILLTFPNNSVGKESTCNAGDPTSIPWSERSTGEVIGYPLQYSLASLVAQLVKNPTAVQETWVRSLGWEDPLKKGIVLPTPVFWPGEFHGLYSPCGHSATFTFTFS